MKSTLWQVRMDGQGRTCIAATTLPDGPVKFVAMAASLVVEEASLEKLKNLFPIEVAGPRAHIEAAIHQYMLHLAFSGGTREAYEFLKPMEGLRSKALAAKIEERLAK